MIKDKYKDVYNTFINHYKDVHVNPWHEISEDELNSIYNNLINDQDIDDDYSFNYLMNYIIKRLSGKDDCHTSFYNSELLPVNFRIFDKDVLVNYPDDLKGYKLDSINGIDINTIINELDNVITYGTEGKKIYELEKALFNKSKLFGLPIFRDSDSLTYSFNNNGDIVNKVFNKEDDYTEEMFNIIEYRYGKPGTYSISDNNLIINHSSVQNMFKDKITNMVDELYGLDLDNIDNIIVDLRGNTGGNSLNNKPVIDFVKNSNKNIICLTDYRVFSGGRYALLDLKELGATTIGDYISTPLNCYGNSDWTECDNYKFSSSSWYLAPNMNMSASSKEEFNSKFSDVKSEEYVPDIYIKQSKEDYLNDVDTVLEFAVNYSKKNKSK